MRRLARHEVVHLAQAAGDHARPAQGHLLQMELRQEETVVNGLLPPAVDRDIKYFHAALRLVLFKQLPTAPAADR